MSISKTAKQSHRFLVKALIKTFKTLSLDLTCVDSLKIPEKTLAILQKYKDNEPKHNFIFPEPKVLDELNEYEVQRKIAYAGKRLEKALKAIVKETKISKNISMHISCHSFAQIAGDKISIQLLQRLYRHSNIMTTIGYQGQFINRDTNNALDLV